MPRANRPRNKILPPPPKDVQPGIPRTVTSSPPAATDISLNDGGVLLTRRDNVPAPISRTTRPPP